VTDAPGLVILIGASSPVARALAEQWAARGHALALGGRDTDGIGRIAADLNTRYHAAVRPFEYDALQPPAAKELLDSLAGADRIDGVVVAVADMGDEQRARNDEAYAAQMRRINVTGLMPVLEEAAQRLAAGGHGFVIGIGSVAGDRPRKSNYTYGAAKAELAAFLAELRRRGGSRGVHVLTVKPGYVDTRMTWNKSSPIAASPAQVARDVVRALDSGKGTLYTPWFWRWIMLVVRLLPKPLFRVIEGK
jgi:short-subunit dehydrogenase